MNVLSDLTDELLVKIYAEGNNDAFDVLLERYKEKVFSCIIYIVRNEEVANDIFQDTFMKAVITIQQGRYTENGRFGAWLSRIAHNLVIDYFRQSKSENCVSGDNGEKNLWNNVKLAESAVESRMIHDEVIDDVRLLVDHLPATQREVVEMRFYQGLSFKEIAELTGVSINTALGRMRYALINLRKLAVRKELCIAI